MKVTYEIAHAAGWDAGNVLMRKLGLTEWSEECLIRASEVMNKLWPYPGLIDGVESMQSNGGTNETQ